jgi:cellulose synthase/poly-beta-1,6-N-acetylglucosamine synthase-like glycosyltransferase
VSVVVCTRDRPVLLERCLVALALQTLPPDEVRVVDNTSGDPRVRAIAERFGATYQVEPRVGLSRARNAGARAARTEIVCYTDDDAVPEPTWVENLVEEFQDPRVAAVGGAVDPIKVETEAEKWMAALEAAAGPRRERRAIAKADKDWFASANFGGLGDGNNMAFRRDVFEQFPGFDERLGRGAPLRSHEDHYILSHLIARDFTVVYTPRAVVRHPFPESMEELRHELGERRTDVAAYFVFLFFDAPENRWALLRFALARLRGVRPPWRVDGSSPRPRLLSLRHRARCAVAGPWLYFTARMRPSPVVTLSRELQPAS